MVREAVRLRGGLQRRWDRWVRWGRWGRHGVRIGP